MNYWILKVAETRLIIYYFSLILVIIIIISKAFFIITEINIWCLSKAMWILETHTYKRISQWIFSHTPNNQIIVYAILYLQDAK